MSWRAWVEMSYGIILHDTDSDQAIEIATRLEKTLEQPIALNDQFVDLSAGIGIAGYPDHASDVENTFGTG